MLLVFERRILREIKMQGKDDEALTLNFPNSDPYYLRKR
jgi:hypothetical protein